MAKTWILCMWSGGIDSTGALYKLLTDEQYEDYNIHVHHMMLNNWEGRMGAEHEAVTNCRKWLEKNTDRPFKFTKSSHDYKFMGNHFIWDVDYIAFMAAQICRCTSNTYEYRVLGRTATDDAHTDTNVNGRAARAAAIIDGVFLLETFREKPKVLYPVVDMTKREIWDIMPEDLRKHTWWCRKPKQDEKYNWITCGECITCHDVKEMLNE